MKEADTNRKSDLGVGDGKRGRKGEMESRRKEEGVKGGKEGKEIGIREIDGVKLHHLYEN